MKLLKVKYIMFLKEKFQYLCCSLILAATLSACPVLKFNVDDQLGSKNSVGRLTKSRLIVSPIASSEYQKVKQEVAEKIINTCTRQGIQNLNNVIQLRQCLEFVNMKCNENNFCQYSGYIKSESGGRWYYTQYDADIDINKGWHSLIIKVTTDGNYKTIFEERKE
nr:hypothetical protein [uncultured Kingella sp.]